MPASDSPPILRDRRETVVVNGVFAVRSRRLEAAREMAIGRQVMAVEHFAMRLAGGFLRLVSHADLKKAIGEVLDRVDLGDLEPIKDKAGTKTAAARSLMRYWLAGIEPGRPDTAARLDAIARLDAAVAEVLPANSVRPGDLARLAEARAHLAPAVMGRVIFQGMTDLHPVWRPLLRAVARHCEVVWEAGPRHVPEWIEAAGARVTRSPATEPEVSAVTCANPRHEAIEAMRWARSLIASGKAAPAEIAIATAGGEGYDSLFAALREESDIRLCMSRGVPALCTPEGQMAAALADVLLRGLSQKRVRRLVEAVGTETGAFAGLPDGWHEAIDADAALAKAEWWSRALERKPETADAARILMPVINLLAKGAAEAAEEAGDLILPEPARQIWKAALLDGPPGALDRTLPSRRVADRENPASSPCYMSAEDLAASPRKYVRLVGLVAGNWPRKRTEDPLIPAHVVDPDELDPLPLPEADRRDYETIMRTAAGVVLSRPRRDSDGRLLACSALAIDRFDSAERLVGSRIPEHAMSEADRILARPEEFRQRDIAKSATEGWHARLSQEATAHDGLIPAGHPRVAAVFRQTQSASSLRLLLRDPAAFLWKYALGFRAPEAEDEPLALHPRHAGTIVHDILRQAVKAMKPRGGFAAIPPEELRATVDSCSISVGTRFELSNPVPPALVWHVAMQRAVDMASNALLSGMEPLPGQDSFVEAPFGGNYEWAPEDVPWDPCKEVAIAGTGIRLSGFIDRVDVSADALMARVVDYKSGSGASVGPETVIAGGKQLQRAIYGFAVRSLLGDEVQIESALHYPGEDAYYVLPDPDGAMAALAGFLEEAKASLEAGNAFPGPDAAEPYNEMKFALPANASAKYLAHKGAAFAERLAALEEAWSHA